jgi:bacillopeptidase F (M6 metalloprotease family)
MADQSFKRLGGTFTIPENGRLSFWASFDIEADWDFGFVEIRPVGSDAWTTLPDINGLTSNETGESCISGWVEEIHPQLSHYMNDSCEPTGTTGEWNAFSGNSKGWQQIQIDLSTYSGQDVELYISYASDWGTQGLGLFVDDIELTGYSLEDFETGTGDWQVSSTDGNNPFNNWVTIEGAGFPEGPVMRTDSTVYMGFGFESIDDNDTRTEIMGRVINYLTDDNL